MTENEKPPEKPPETPTPLPPPPEKVTPPADDFLEAAKQLKTQQEELKTAMDKFETDKKEFNDLMKGAEQGGRSIVNAQNNETEEQRDIREQKERFAGTGLDPFRPVKDPFVD